MVLSRKKVERAARKLYELDCLHGYLGKHPAKFDVIPDALKKCYSQDAELVLKS